MQYELVIFDNDGVLVDSEPLSNRILAAYLTEVGHPTTYEDSIRDYMGAAVHRVHDVVRERSGQELPADFDATLPRAGVRRVRAGAGAGGGRGDRTGEAGGGRGAVLPGVVREP